MDKREYGLMIASIMAENSYMDYDRKISAENRVMRQFKNELLSLGLQFSYLHDSLRYMPEKKDMIVPVAIKYLKMADTIKDKETILKWLYYYGLFEAVPVLLEEFENTPMDNDIGYHWRLGDVMYEIRCPKYAEEYMRIVQNPEYGTGRQMIILLLGRIKCHESEPLLLKLLSDESVNLHVISALGSIGESACIPYLNNYIDSKRSVIRKASKKAIEKIERREEKKRVHN